VESFIKLFITAIFGILNGGLFVAVVCGVAGFEF
jgi:hypothetical protein